MKPGDLFEAIEPSPNKTLIYIESYIDPKFRDTVYKFYDLENNREFIWVLHLRDFNTVYKQII
jgi:hypothetical protein